MRRGYTRVKAYFELLKPRVMSLAILSAAVGMMAAPTNHLSWGMHLVGLFFIALGAGASGCFNMWWEGEQDSLMERTKARPLPAKIISPHHAVVVACVLTLASLLGLWKLFNTQAALWMAATIGYYVVIYTMCLKPRTDQSIVWGGLAGALPPLIGEAVVCGHTTMESWLLCALIFFWTPAHFWALALFCWKDYVAAGFPILPQTKGTKRTKRDIVYYSVMTAIISFIPWWLGLCKFIYGFGALWLGCMWIARALQLFHNKRSPKSFFAFSIVYLFSLLILRIVDLFVLAYRW